MTYIILYVQLTAAGGDLGADEAHCAMMGEEEEDVNVGQQSSFSSVGPPTVKGKGKPSAVLLSSLQQQLQESAKQVQQLQQSMKPPTEQEVFGQYVKGALMTMSRRRYRRARREIGAILESLQDSDDEEQVVRSQVAASLPPHASWKGPLTSRSTSAPSFPSLSPSSGNAWQPQPHMWKIAWPPTGTPWQSQEFTCMDKYAAGSIIPPHPPQFPHNRQQYGQQHRNMLLDTGAVDASDLSLPSGLRLSLPELSRLSGLLDTSLASATGSAGGMNTPATTAAAAQQY